MSKESIEWLNQNTLIGMTNYRGTAWHNRDDIVMVDGLTNHYAEEIPEADILSRLFNWKGVERPIYVQTDLGMMPIEGRKALMRSDNGYVMGIHGEGYQGHDYSEWLIHNLSRLVGESSKFANAGLLRFGAVAWVQIEMPENVKTASGVEFRPSILAGTSFDGSLATFFKPVVTNVVCDNTMSAAMSEGGAIYRLKHTKNSSFVLADAQAALDMLSATAETVTAQIDALTAVPVSDKEWSEFVTAHVPVADGAIKRSVTRAENIRTALTGLWRTDVRVAPWNGTAWGVVQAVNTYNEHMATMRGSTQRFERKMMRAIGDDMRNDDRATIATLSTIKGRELLAV